MYKKNTGAYSSKGNPMNIRTFEDITRKGINILTDRGEPGPDFYWIII